MSGVASKNPFALLDEGNSRPSSPPPASKATPAPPAPAKPQAQKSGPRGGKYYQRGGARSSNRGEGNPNQNGVEDAEAAPKKFENRGRGRGGARGGRGVRRDRPDRHSATGKTDSDKKIHQGWGGDDGNTELQAEAAATVDAAAEQAWGTSGNNEASAWDAPAGDENAAAPAATEGKPERENRRREEEEEDNTLTLDQYLAQKKEKEASALPEKPQARQANEGADAWKDVAVLQKGADEETYFAGKGKATHKARAKKEEKVFIEIDGRFANDRPRGGRGRGGDRGRGGRGGDRGGDRGRGGRGGRQNNSGQAKLDVDDQAAFPSLS